MTEPILKQGRGDGIRLQLAEWPGDGIPILAIHGLTANCRCWDAIAPNLSPTHRVITYDLRGRGKSDKPDTGYSQSRHAADLHALIRDLGLDEVILMGHSLGAYIAMAFVRQYPGMARKVILIDGGGDLSSFQWKRVGKAIGSSIGRLGKRFADYDAYVSDLRRLSVFSPWTTLMDTYFRYEIKTVDGKVMSRINPDHIAEETRNMGKIRPRKLYPYLNCPALILRATDGIISPRDIILPKRPLRRMLKKMPDARCVDISGTNHYSILFQSNLTRDQAILDFLAVSE